MDLPSTNLNYGQKDYWQTRFQAEDQYDWLGNFTDFKQQLLKVLPNKEASIMVVGCGNSTLSIDMSKEGYTQIVSSDYSQNVIEKMKLKHPQLRWQVVDLTDMSAIPSHSYDVVLDKGVLDAFMVGEGSVWDPQQQVIDTVHKALSQIKRVLKQRGKYIQISFQQPHFRKRYLTTKSPVSVSETDSDNNLYNWSVQTINLQHGLGYFIFVCQLKD